MGGWDGGVEWYEDWKESSFVLKHGKKRSLTHIWKEDTISLCFSALMCTRIQEWPFRHVPDNSTHRRVNTLPLYSWPGSTHTPSVTLVSACVLLSRLTAIDDCTCLSCLFNKKFCLETLRLQLLSAGGANLDFYQ